MQLLNTVVARAIPWIPRALVRTISRRYIAGDDLAHAVARIRQLNAQGYSATVDVLGESVTSLAQAESTAAEYLQVLDAIQTHGLDASVSLKPTAMGLLLDSSQCEQWLERILQSAQHNGTSVCLDMEDVRCTQAEIDMFLRLRARHGHISLALQAYLQRTHRDIETLLRNHSDLRLCKGIYLEDHSHLVEQAWRDRTAINPHFLAHVASCFEADRFVAIATHDAALIAQTITLAQRNGVDKSRFEFQMLLGVCEPLRDQLLATGYAVRIYVPYGRDWYGYSTRRLKENPAIAGHILRALLTR
ncbi:MAG: proline dehydrogenase family protein [Pseudomonadota bacterium]